MTAAFSRACADATPLGTVRLFLSAAADEVLNAVAVHWTILLQDLHYTARTLTRARGMAFTAILATALGVGANTAAFSVADFVLLRPLPSPTRTAGAAVRGPARGRRLGLHEPAVAG